ncbi:MAG: phenylacetate--CoA ligase family protein [Syntrophobacteraceae bacterium]
MPIRNTTEECMDAEERAQQQLERLQSALNRAYKNVPFYRNHLQRADRKDPAQIEELSELSAIPFTERHHLSENYPYGLFAVPLRDVVRIHTAPGATLQPSVSGYTRQDLSLWRNLVARALIATGAAPTDIMQIALDSGLANWGRDYKDGAEAIEASVIPLTILSPQKQLMVLRDYKTSVLVTTAPAAAQINQQLFQSNVNPNALSLRTLILVGEAPDAAIREQLEEQLHVRTWAHYGLSEVPGPAIAFECETRQGLHISEDHFFPEVVHPETGEVLPEGEEGELILTTLTTRAYPLIRFRTGDRVRFLSGVCPCGRTLRRIEWLPQRAVNGVISIRGVKVHKPYAQLLIERLLGPLPTPPRIAAIRHDLHDHLEVWLPADEDIFSDEIKNLEALIRSVADELTRELGVPVSVRLKEKHSFESPEK